jgi:hypothetical protein
LSALAGGEAFSCRVGFEATSNFAASIRRPDDEAELDRTMKSRKEQLTWAKQRALICVGMGHFSDAVAGLRADLAESP